jgi:hypothetical protein
VPFGNPLKRWPVLLAFLVAVGALAVGLVFLPGSRVTRENCERIKDGMTEAEVRAILGKPLDDSLLDPDGPSDRMLAPFRIVHARNTLCPSSFFWMGNDVAIHVAFDGQGRVGYMSLCTDLRPRSWLPARVWRRLRARYGW